MDRHINGVKAQKKKRVRWTPDAEKVLLQLWKNVFNELKTAKRKWNIYVRMATKLVHYGYNFTAYEIKMKLHNLSNKYKAERNKLRLSRYPISDWSMYKPLDYLLGNNRTQNWKDLIEEYVDPLNAAAGELHANDDDLGEEGNELKMEIDIDNQSDSNHNKEASDVVDSTQITYSSSDKDDNEDEQSESELTRNSERCFSVPKESLREERINENPGSFRIIADRVLPSNTNNDAIKSNQTVTTSQTSKIDRPLITPKSFAKQKVAKSAHSTPSLAQAKWQLIQLQKDKTIKEMEYRRKEFEQQSKEHELRLRHMEEEHQLRMTSLRKQIHANRANDE